MQWDAIVVGGGPSGLVTAAELAGSGARTLVLERRTEGVQSRAGTLLPRVLELFDARGIAGRFVERTRRISPYPFRPSHIWAGFHPIEWHYFESRFGVTLGLPQNETEALLWDWAVESGAQIQRGVEVRGLSQDGDGVEVETVDTSGRVARIRASYVVGADGGRSAVRKALDLPFEGRSGTFRGIVFDAELDAPWPGGRINVDNEMGWVRGYAFGEGITRFNIVHRDRRHAAKDDPVTLDEALQCIRDVHGTDYGIRSHRWASRFDDQMRAVPALRSGRVFLVGESARIHYPASGVGMNFCLQDAFNLGWKLANVLKGTAPAETLDSYNDERLPVMRELLASVMAQCALQFNFGEEGVALKRRMQSEVIPQPDVQRKLVLELCGLSQPYPRPPGSHALAGCRAPDIDVLPLEGEPLRLTELLRRREFVLLDLEGYSGQFDALPLDGLPVRRMQARLGRVPAELRGVTGLLVRPDAYVAWAGTDPAQGAAQARAELGRWLRGLQP
ncbi:Pentachlorophenol 4-monooxygenase [Pigmentiphaga humi]|uniref:Pentachlorophenol 4-monooxygenase n=1 Tax=Pigmentiphaga humi TaxID=2478468 RepID=A0A3P4B226_9BURK|nr:FAD-dependent monooxygenase [Pigmentiphaga humi]VCU69185.1 Pentachlorophenol 4-monooxygenase [Pigmentiphaga humi]